MNKQNNMTADERYCYDCIHCEMCRWFPYYGCEFKETLKEAVEAEPVNDNCSSEPKGEPMNGNWISVEDRFPEKEQRVLVFYKALGKENRIHNDVMATNWRTKKGDFIPCDGYKVTHWMPLSEPPKEDKDGKG